MVNIDYGFIYEAKHMKWPIFNPINRRLLRPVSISQKDHFKGLYDYVLSILKIWFVFRGALHVIRKLCQKSKQKFFLVSFYAF